MKTDFTGWLWAELAGYLPPVWVVQPDGKILWSSCPDTGKGLFIQGDSLSADIAELITSEAGEARLNIAEEAYEVAWMPAHLADQEVLLVIADPYSYTAWLKTAYRQIQKQSQTLRQLFNLPYEGTIYVDSGGIIQMVNDAFCTYVGINAEDLIGHALDDYKIDPGLLETIRTGKPDYLAFYPQPKLIASRQPVFQSGRVIGAFGRYGALDLKCIERRILDANDYIDIVSGMKTRDILFNVSQFLIELNSYKDEFRRLHSSNAGIESIKGSSPAITKLKADVLQICHSPSSVLITGESGTGKELFAQAIHYHGDRRIYPFVKVNCAAIPESLLESELFGYVEGAFTGARKKGKMGKFELANQGVVFLDEIGDMSLAMQAKLLRVLQEKEIERVGDEKSIAIDVRIVSATNQDLMQLVNQGRFRPDLYYRLNVINLHIPPLRERRDDISEICEYVIEELNRKLHHSITQISPQALELLTAYNWPGNIRELINVLETAMNFCRGNVLEAEGLPIFLQPAGRIGNAEVTGQDLHSDLTRLEKEKILAALKCSQGERQMAAELLGISRSTLYRLMKKHRLL
ncbi:MAG: sigma-54 interaction domain-containing protein [Methylocystaceae bacterium]